MMHLTDKNLLVNEDNFTFLSTFGFHRLLQKKWEKKDLHSMTIKTKLPLRGSGMLLSAACQSTLLVEII